MHFILFEMHYFLINMYPESNKVVEFDCENLISVLTQ
jgi:hypothetical protein